MNLSSSFCDPVQDPVAGWVNGRVLLIATSPAAYLFCSQRVLKPSIQNRLAEYCGLLVSRLLLCMVSLRVKRRKPLYLGPYERKQS